MKETKKLNNEEMEKVTGGEASDYIEDILSSKCDELAELEAQGLIDSYALQAASAEPEAIASILAENRSDVTDSRYLRVRRRTTSLPHQRRRTSASRSSAGRLA